MDLYTVIYIDWNTGREGAEAVHAKDGHRALHKVWREKPIDLRHTVKVDRIVNGEKYIRLTFDYSFDDEAWNLTTLNGKH